MNSELLHFLNELWKNKPAIIILFAVGLVIFVFFVIDTHRHRKKRKELRRPGKRLY